MDCAVGPWWQTGLVARAIAGDHAAWSALFWANVGPLTRLCTKLSGLDADDVDDVVQETFVRAFANLHRLRSPARFRPWLLAIARHRAFSLLRSRASDEERRACAAPWDDRVELIPESFVEEARARVVQQLIAGLARGGEAEAVRLYYVDGCRTPEIVARQGVGKSCVTMRLERFRCRVRRGLGRQLTELGLLTPRAAGA